jgi:hypothetical protein
LTARAIASQIWHLYCKYWYSEPGKEYGKRIFELYDEKCKTFKKAFSILIGLALLFRMYILYSLVKLSAGDSHLDDGAYHIVGEVTNQGNQKATFVKVSGAFYNSSNTVVAADFTFTDPQDLESGQAGPFEIIVNTPTANEITTSVKGFCISGVLEA